MTFKGKGGELEIFVVAGTKKSLLGRDGLHILGLMSQFSVNVLDTQGSAQYVQSILAKHKAIFRDELGLITGIKATIRLDQSAIPIFFKSRTVPLALRPKIDQTLDRLESIGILKRVDYSDWSTPIVPVPKPDGSVRICGDYSVTLNRFMKAEYYPLPRLEELFAILRGGVSFTKIDLSDAYHQIELDEESKALTTINTHRGLYQYQRLCFGLSSAPSIFERLMDSSNQGTKWSGCVP